MESGASGGTNIEHDNGCRAKGLDNSVVCSISSA